MQETSRNVDCGCHYSLACIASIPPLAEPRDEKSKVDLGPHLNNGLALAAIHSEKDMDIVEI